MWPPHSHLLTHPLTADKHLLASLFDNINPSTDGCHLTGVFSCLAFVADNYTHTDNMWTHFQASVLVTIPPLPFSPPFTSHFQCIQHLTGPDSQQCREAFKEPIKSLFSLSIYEKEFIIEAHLSIQSSPPHSIFFPHGRLLLTIFSSSSSSLGLTLPSTRDRPVLLMLFSS